MHPHPHPHPHPHRRAALLLVAGVSVALSAMGAPPGARAAISPSLADVSVALTPAATGHDIDADGTAAQSGGADGFGNRLSATNLAALGLAPINITLGGVPYVWPFAGLANAVIANAQTLAPNDPQAGSSLDTLLTAFNGSQSVAVTVTYGDGSATVGTLAAPDWCSGTATGRVVQMTYRLTTTGTQDTGCTPGLYLSTLALTAGKTVQSVTLGVNSNLHLYAMSVAGSAAAPIPGALALGDATGAQPSDMGLAVGPDSVLEVVNGGMTVVSKTGAVRLSTTLEAVLGLPATGYGGYSDVRATYDGSSGRFFVSAISAPPCDATHTACVATVTVGVSNGPDPAGAWTRHTTQSTSWTYPASGYLYDHPALLVTTDKVITISNDPTGTNVSVTDKADLIANTTLHTFSFPLDSSIGINNVAIPTLVTAPEGYLVADQSSGSALEVIKVSGLPSAGTTAETKTTLTLAPALPAAPPDMTQPLTTTLLSSGGRYYFSAAWNAALGVLWTTTPGACVSGGVTRSCIHLVKVSTSGTPSLLLQADITPAATAYQSFPAVAIDATGAVHGVSVGSSTADFLSVWTFLLTPAGALLSYWERRAGTNVMGTPGSPQRLGDYSAAAIDPVTGGAWVAADYAEGQHTWQAPQGQGGGWHVALYGN